MFMDFLHSLNYTYLMQRFLLSAILFFLVLITFALFFFFYETRFFGSRASVTGVDISLENSYAFASPTSVYANGQDKVRVTIFILDSQGRGVYGKQIVPMVDGRVALASSSPTTDSLGKATFDYTSLTPGDYYLQIGVDAMQFPQKLHLSFTQP